MIRRPPRSTRTDTLFPYTTLFRAEIAKLHRFGFLAEDFGGVYKLLRGLLLTFRVYDLGAPLALSFRLARYGADHRFGDVDILDRDIGDLDPPGVGLGVEDLLDVGVELVALGEHVVQFVLAEDRTQGGLGKFAGRLHEVFDLNGRPFRIDHPKIDHRADRKSTRLNSSH